MNELLTTGQLVDKLKIGEKAIGKFVDNDILHDVELEVYRCEDGHIKESTSNTTISLTKGIVEEVQWYILPKYVLFDEAMKALKEGKMVKLHRNNNLDVTIFRKWYKLESREDVTFTDLFNGKWTIEED